jgi:CelD/BcsL family acetyltransferase involved in cellulose biosynthesis
MVDAVPAFDGKVNRSRAPVRAGRVDAQVSVTAATGSALVAYRALARDGIVAPPQSAAWIEGWIARARPDVVMATMTRDGETVFALALEVIRKGPFRIARFMGGTHANGNFALARRSWLAQSPETDVAALVAAIRKARPDIDVLALERLLPSLGGMANPLMCLPRFRSANISLAVDLAGGFDALLSRSSGKRKRKKYRSQSRKFDAAGGHRRIEAGTPAEVDRLLEAFFAMKDVRFRKAGIRNVFGEPQVRAFFRGLFVDALAVTPRPFVLHGLEVGGSLRAITGSSLRGDTLICEFGAIVEDELANASPGDYLFFENIREACEAGLAVYDFSVGDELYKRLWCDIESEHVDVVVPLTMKGRLLAQGARRYARAKAFIKNSPLVWKLTKTLRRRAAGQPTATAASSSED